MKVKVVFGVIIASLLALGQISTASSAPLEDDIEQSIPAESSPQPDTPEPVPPDTDQAETPSFDVYDCTQQVFEI